MDALRFGHCLQARVAMSFPTSVHFCPQNAMAFVSFSFEMKTRKQTQEGGMVGKSRNWKPELRLIECLPLLCSGYDARMLLDCILQAPGQTSVTWSVVHKRLESDSCGVRTHALAGTSGQVTPTLASFATCLLCHFLRLSPFHCPLKGLRRNGSASDTRSGSSNLSGLIFLPAKTTPKALSMVSDTSAPKHTRQHHSFAAQPETLWLLAIRSDQVSYETSCWPLQLLGFRLPFFFHSSQHC